MASDYLPLFSDYRSHFVDPFADLEEIGISRNDGQFSYPEIHSEIRMAFTHFSRHVLGFADKDELVAAQKHIQRAQMDTYKCLYLENRRQIDELIQRYERFSIEELDNGGFFEHLCKEQETSRSFFEEGKQAETQGFHDQASKCYEAANGMLKSEHDYVCDKLDAMGRAKRNYFGHLKYQVVPIVILAFTIAIWFLGW